MFKIVNIFKFILIGFWWFSLKIRNLSISLDLLSVKVSKKVVNEKYNVLGLR